MYSQPRRPRHRGARRDRRPRHGDRDRGAQVRGAAPLLAGDAGAGRGAARQGRAPADRRTASTCTDVPLVTIDGEDARDFDDAVYCEPAKVGRGKGWRLVVAIADVSHYVKPGEPLDDDAYERATSVYFPRRVIPMLPEKLSNGLCSLNPDESTAWRWSATCWSPRDGEIHAYQFFPAVIRSQARFTYTEVAAILANTRGPEAARREALVPHLLNLHDVYRALLKARAKRGAIDFETTETQIVCDENGRIEKIVPRTRTEAHRLIEEAMLAANVCSADFIARAKHPALYRVHEGPTPEKKTLLQNYLKALGLGLSIGDDPKPAEFQAIAAGDQGPARRAADPHDAAALDAAGDLHRHQQRPLRPGLRGLHALHEPDPPLSRPAGAPRHQGAARRQALPPRSRAGNTRRCRAKAARRKGAKAELPARRCWRRAASSSLGGRRRALQRQRAPRRRSLARRRGLAQVPLHARAPRRGVRRHGQRGDQLRPVRHARRPVRRRPGAHHRARRRVLPLRRGRQELRGERTGMRYVVGARVRVQVSRVDLDGRKIDFRMVREGEDLRRRREPGATRRWPTRRRRPRSPP